VNCTDLGTPLGCKPDPAYPQGEVCNGKDDDGDGVIDNLLLSTCLINGVCGGTQSCSGGVLSCIPSGGTTNAPACTSVDGYPGHYNCDSSGRLLGCRPDNSLYWGDGCDGKDNDGDGIIDNAVGSTVPSSVTGDCNYPKTWPSCPKPVRRCVNGKFTTCDYSYTVVCSTYCNGVQMTAQCSANNGTLGPCLGPPETCNGEDDNCDGQIDEGSVCTQQATCQ
jgi:hypothetical protein